MDKIPTHYETLFPNGVKARPISLKCCIPKGIPTIVMQKSMPSIKCCRHISIPPVNIQIILKRVLKQPDDCSLYSTSCPNGTKASTPSLKSCNPNGIPIIVIHEIIPSMMYSMEMISPPKMIQIMFPSSVIMFIS